MYRKLLLALVITCFASVSGAYAAEKDTAKSKAKDMAKEEKSDKKICKLMQDTGTFLKRRVCETQEEWDRILGTNKAKKKGTKS
jgi:hypothetical protein